MFAQSTVSAKDEPEFVSAAFISIPSPSDWKGVTLVGTETVPCAPKRVKSCCITD